MTQDKLRQTRVSDQLLRAVKVEAARQGRTMTDCLGEAVQEWLDSHRVEREMLQWMRQQQQDPAP